MKIRLMLTAAGLINSAVLVALPGDAHALNFCPTDGVQCIESCLGFSAGPSCNHFYRNQCIVLSGTCVRDTQSCPEDVSEDPNDDDRCFDTTTGMGDQRWPEDLRQVG